MIFNFLANEGGQGGDQTLTFVIMGVLIVAIIGLFVWQTISGKKKQKEAQEMVDSLKIGDKIKTIGGVCGYLVEINNAENTIVIETGNDQNKSYIKFDKGAIYQTGSAASATNNVEKKEEDKKTEAPKDKKGKKAEDNAPVEEVKKEEVKAEENKETVFEEEKKDN